MGDAWKGVAGLEDACRFVAATACTDEGGSLSVADNVFFTLLRGGRFSLDTSISSRSSSPGSNEHWRVAAERSAM